MFNSLILHFPRDLTTVSQNPTLQAIFPLQANLNILRTLDPSLSPSPNVTSFGSAGSAFARVLYDGVEQFYCSATGCTQTFGNDTSDWSCTALKCACRPGTAFCGAVPVCLPLFQVDHSLTIYPRRPICPRFSTRCLELSLFLVRLPPANALSNSPSCRVFLAPMV